MIKEPASNEVAGEKVLSPQKLAHVVLRSSDKESMTRFYETFLGGRIVFTNEALSFITYDEEHHRIAILQVPGTEPKNKKSCGLEHIAFTYPTLKDLFTAYRQRKAHKILPIWSVNHGATTSIYYRDPDGNMLETQVDNFDTNEKTNNFALSGYFAENPVGTDIDPEDMMRRLENGESEEVLKRRVEIGPRSVPDLDEM